MARMFPLPYSNDFLMKPETEDKGVLIPLWSIDEQVAVPLPSTCTRKRRFLAAAPGTDHARGVRCSLGGLCTIPLLMSPTTPLCAGDVCRGEELALRDYFAIMLADSMGRPGHPHHT